MWTKHQFIVLLCSLSLIVIGLLSIASFILDIDQLRHWSGTDGMALNSAICFVLIGFVFIKDTRYYYGPDEQLQAATNVLKAAEIAAKKVSDLAELVAKDRERNNKV